MELTEIQQIMTSGKETRFWALIAEHLNERIALYTDKILEGEDLDEAENKKLKNKLSVYRYMLNLPDILVRNEQAGKGREDDSDPYEKRP